MVRRVIPSGHLFWSQNWRRPYESHASLLAKMTWLNGLNVYQVELVEKELSRQSGHFYSIINQQAPQEWELPINPVLLLSRPKFHFCPSCLSAGFHTDIPQIIGLKSCPIHKLPFIKDCGNCSAPITNLGHPHFDKTAIYLCWYCKRSLAGREQNIITQWRKLSNQAILDAYSPYLPSIRSAASQCSGYWHLHPREVAYIFLYTTGLIASNLDGFLTPKAVPKILNSLSASEYVLPLPHDELGLAVSAIMWRDQNELRARFAALSMPDSLPDSNAKHLPFYHLYLNQLHFREGGNLLESALVIQKTLMDRAYRPAQLYPSIYALPDKMPDSDKAQILFQLFLLTAAHSLFQILMLLDRLEVFFRKSRHFKDFDYEAIHHFSKMGDLFAGTLCFVTKTQDGFIFSTDVERWLPSFQLKIYDDKPRLRIFRSNISKLLSNSNEYKPRHPSNQMVS